MDNIGIDLVRIAEFQKRLDASGGVEMVFTGSELTQNQKVEGLAGIFAAKEAFMKAIGRKVGWHDVWVEKMPNGQPLLTSHVLVHGQKTTVSIAHDGAYAIAVVILGE